MKLRNKLVFLAIVTLCASGCGGGGGSGSSAQAEAPAASTGGGSGTGTGGTTGGTTGGGSNSVIGGLLPGGASLESGSAGAGVELDVARGGTGASFDFGDIQAFSSVVLNGATVNTDAAEFLIEGISGSQSDLVQGQQVLVISNANGTAANGVHYRSNVKGPVTSVASVDADLGTGVFTVLGQRVLTDAATAFSNVNLADIGISDLLEVSGTLNASGDIQASFIELKSSLAEFKVTGVTSATTATSFLVNDLVVDYSSATLQDFNGAIANGDIVEVKAPPAAFTAPNQFTAARVELLPALTIGASVPARIEGYIDRFVSAADFDIQTAPVSTDANTIFETGSSASLALNVKVQAEGSFDSNGTLLATKITVQRTDAIRAEGHIEAVDAATNTLEVLGVSFLVRESTRFEDKSSANQSPFALSDLGIGDEVEIRGYLDGTQVVATRIEREDATDRARLRGPVTAESVQNNTVDVLSIRLAGQTGITQYEDVNDVVITQAEFHDAVGLGTIVKGTWDVFVDSSQTVDELSIED